MMILTTLSLVKSMKCTLDPLMNAFETIEVELLVTDQVD